MAKGGKLDLYPDAKFYPTLKKVMIGEGATLILGVKSRVDKKIDCLDIPAHKYASITSNTILKSHKVPEDEDSLCFTTTSGGIFVLDEHRNNAFMKTKSASPRQNTDSHRKAEKMEASRWIAPSIVSVTPGSNSQFNSANNRDLFAQSRSIVRWTTAIWTLPPFQASKQSQDFIFLNKSRSNH